MKILTDLISSISGNTRARVSEPLVGAFIASWIACNWNHLTILIWGEGNITERVNTFQRFLSDTPFFALNSIFTIPAILTAFYLFILPWISLISKSALEIPNKKLHQQAVTTELDKVVSQHLLDEARLRSNPDKPFLEESIRLANNRKKELQELLKQRTLRFKAKAAEAVSKAVEAASMAEEAASKKIDTINKTKKAQQEIESKKIQLGMDKIRFNTESQNLKTKLESERFPSAFLYMTQIENKLKLDDIQLSVSSTAEIVSAIFGYKDFQDLISDKTFNNETLSKAEYIYHDKKNLAERFNKVLSNEETRNEQLISETLYEHILEIFNESHLKPITFDEFEEKASDFFDKYKYDLLDGNELSSEIAISDTIFEEIVFDSMDYPQNIDGITVTIQAIAKGSHRKHESARGQDMAITVEVKGPALAGNNAIGALEFGYISGKIIDTYEESDRY